MESKEERHMRFKLPVKTSYPPFLRKSAFLLSGMLLAILLMPAKASADPVMVQTGIISGYIWPLLLCATLFEAGIIFLFTRGNFLKLMGNVVIANAITGFIALVGIAVMKNLGTDIIPVGPLAISSFIFKAGIYLLSAYQVNFKKLLAAVAVSNITIATVAIIILSNAVIPSRSPDQSADMLMSQALIRIHHSLEQFRDGYGTYPASLTGGDSANDPLIQGRILDNYPDNPYHNLLVTKRFSPLYLATGYGPHYNISGNQGSDLVFEVRVSLRNKLGRQFGPGLASLRTLKSHEFTPGSFFYQSYDVNNDGIFDDYILGAIGWPESPGTYPVDILDAGTGTVHLVMDDYGEIYPGEPDGLPESTLGILIDGTDIRK